MEHSMDLKLENYMRAALTPNLKMNPITASASCTNKCHSLIVSQIPSRDSDQLQSTSFKMFPTL